MHKTSCILHDKFKFQSKKCAHKEHGKWPTDLADADPMPLFECHVFNTGSLYM